MDLLLTAYLRNSTVSAYRLPGRRHCGRYRNIMRDLAISFRYLPVIDRTENCNRISIISREMRIAVPDERFSCGLLRASEIHRGDPVFCFFFIRIQSDDAPAAADSEPVRLQIAVRTYIPHLQPCQRVIFGGYDISENDLVYLTGRLDIYLPSPSTRAVPAMKDAPAEAIPKPAPSIPSPACRVTSPKV